MSSRQLKIGKRDGCGTCAGTPEPLQVPSVSCAVPAGIDASEAAALVDAVFVDVREREEYERGHIPGAVCVPLSSLDDSVPVPLPDARAYVVYCSHGPRSVAASEMLARAGVPGVAHLLGGLSEWPDDLESGAVRLGTAATLADAERVATATSPASPKPS
jgi:rhodanese-related sulfurtransferase